MEITLKPRPCRNCCELKEQKTLKKRLLRKLKLIISNFTIAGAEDMSKIR